VKEEGENHYVRTLSPVENPETGEVDRVSVISKDVTELKKREGELVRSREEREEFFDAIPDIAAVISPNHEFVEVNEEGVERLEMDREELIGRKCYRVVHGQDEPIDECPCTKALEAGEPDIGEEFSEGGRHYTAAATPITGENGEIESLVHTVKDITKRKKMEEKLRKSREEYRSLINSMNDGFVVHDLEGNFITGNDVLSKTLRYSEEELQSMNLKDITDEEGGEVEQNIQRVRDEGNLTFETTVKTSQGGKIPVEINANLVEYRDEPAILSIARDVTERKKAEGRIREYKSAVEASDDSIYMIDKDYRYIFANHEHVSRLLDDGKIPRESRGEVVGKKYGDIHPEEELKALKKNVEKALETDAPLTEEYKFLTEDRWSSRTYSPVKNSETGEAEAVVVVSKDITERKKAEEELRQYRRAMESSVDSFAAIDNNYRYLFANEAYRNTFPS
ncbi:hypothetical protein AKJ39_05155, partial [candidate division MSBL1 archaeon SCGC-AAA259J03]